MKRFIALVLTMIIFLSFTGIAQAGYYNPQTGVFEDVPSNHWARKDIELFASRGIVNGVGYNKFNPDGNIIREHFAKILVDTFKADKVWPSNDSFVDVDRSRSTYPYIEASKEFLTGYVNPFGGKPLFSPDEDATREDITVALVKIMGLTETDVEDSDYAQSTFTDADKISPNLLKYVNLAAEQKLIRGYSDGTLRPGGSVTRAEAVALLNRASRHAMSDISSALNLSAKVVDGANPKEVKVIITADEDTKVSLDGKNINMKSNRNGDYEGEYRYTFDKKGFKEFEIKGTKSGLRKTIYVDADFDIDTPELTFEELPFDTSKPNLTLKGELYDPKFPVTLKINGETVERDKPANKTHKWTKDIVLETGKNRIEFVLTNSEGEATKRTRTINLYVGYPELKVDDIPVISKKTKLSGTIYDENYPVELKIDGQVVASNSKPGSISKWNKEIELKEGRNTIDFVLRNSMGKEVKDRKIVDLIIGLPELTIENPKELTSITSKTRVFELRGTMFDENYPVDLFINGKRVASNSKAGRTSWSAEYRLDKDENKNNLEFKLINSEGKSVKMMRDIFLDIDRPELDEIVVSTYTNVREVEVSGTMFDPIYPGTLTIKGDARSPVSIPYSEPGKEVKWRTKIELKNEGKNELDFVFINTDGKEDEKTKNNENTREVELSLLPPELDLYKDESLNKDNRIKDKENLELKSNEEKTYTVYVKMMDNHHAIKLDVYKIDNLGKEKIVRSIGNFTSNELHKEEITLRDLAEGENKFRFALKKTGEDKERSQIINIIRPEV